VKAVVWVRIPLVSPFSIAHMPKQTRQTAATRFLPGASPGCASILFGIFTTKHRDSKEEEG